VAVWQTNPKWKNDPIVAAMAERVPLDYGAFLIWRERQTSFVQIGLWAATAVVLGRDGMSEQLVGARVSPGLFDVLGVKPVLGRGILPGEDVIGGPRVVVVSYETWQTRFGGRQDVVGSTVTFDNAPWTIVGVMPKDFSLDRAATSAGFWIPAGRTKQDVGNGNHSFRAVARLKPNVTMEQARVETAQLLQGETSPDSRGVRLAEYHFEQTRDVRRPLLLLLGAVGLLLLVACVNIATLLLGEGTTRQQEMGARVALGASRGRLVRQLLTESVVLSVVGGALGTLLAWWATKALVALAPARVPGIKSVHVDIRVLTAAFVAALVTGMLFGLLPALATSRRGAAAALRSSGQSARGRGSLQQTLIAVELALSVVLLVGATLLMRSLNKLTAVDPGFRSEHLLVVRHRLPGFAFDSVAEARFYRESIARLTQLPGVAAVTAAGNGVPFTGSASSSGYFKPGEENDQKRRRSAQQRDVLPNYFSVMEIPLLAGRPFTPDDRSGAALVVILSETAAKRDWPNESPIGRRVQFQGEWRTVVGIVADVKHSRLSADDDPTIYSPYDQRQTGAWLLVRTTSDPVPVIPSVRRTLQEVAPAVVIAGIDDMDTFIRRSYGEEQFRTVLIGLFGAMAAVLAAVGMYGVTARAVSGRTREVGIRVALGATSSSVIRLIVSQTFGGVAIGVVVGTAGSIAASGILAPYLFGVSRHDPLTYGAIFAGLTLVAVAASWIPARRAGRVQPATVLRGE
jgi:predicted permease